jgi:hypothetical protein
VLDKAMRKSIESYLQPGEEVLSHMIVQGKGMTGWLAGGGIAGAAVVGAMRDRQDSARGAADDSSDVDVKLSSKMGLAITSQRLLVFKAGGAVTLKAKELLTQVPIGEVDSIEVGKGAITKPLTLTIRGERFQVEAPKASNPNKLVSALQQAKGAQPSVS